MRWKHDWDNGLTLAAADDAELAAALAAIRRLGSCGLEEARTTADRLEEGLTTRFISEYVIISLSRWCDSEGRFQRGVEPARAVSRVLFNGGVLPRLAGARGVRITAREARDLLDTFLADSESRETRPMWTPQPSECRLYVEEGSPSDQDAEFTILGPNRRRITTLTEWLLQAPPARGEVHWKDGRSAKELARRWLPGRIPPEVKALLDATPAFEDFIPQVGYAESKTALDGYGGNTRNADLVVRGVVAAASANLDIEGKADETFGPTIGECVAAAEAKLRQDKPTNALARVNELCEAVLGCEPAAAANLRYQLLHAVAAAVIRASSDGADRVAFIVQVFHSEELRAARLSLTPRTLQPSFKRWAAIPRRSWAAPSSQVPSTSRVVATCRLMSRSISVRPWRLSASQPPDERSRFCFSSEPMAASQHWMPALLRPN